MQAVKCQVRRHLPLACKKKKIITVFQNDNYIIFAVEQLCVTIRHTSKPVKIHLTSQEIPCNRPFCL